jgi:hypothetical protein
VQPHPHRVEDVERLHVGMPVPVVRPDAQHGTAGARRGEERGVGGPATIYGARAYAAF